MNPLHKKPTRDGYITPDEYYVELEHRAARAEKREAELRAALKSSIETIAKITEKLDELI